MPRDSQLLPAASRALLRAARAGCIYVRQSGRATKEEEQNAATAEDQANVNAHIAERSFTSRKWANHPKNLEPPELEFLAKRRAGLPSLYGGPISLDGSSGVTPGPMRRTKFQKVDPVTGSISIYEAWVPEGHRIEGEITGDIQTIVAQSEVPVKPEAPAPGTLVEGVGIVNSEGVVVAEASSAAVVNPNKRRPPPPKRKGKGTGKGRKKKVMFAPGEGADAATVHGVAPSAGGGADAAKVGQDGLPIPASQDGQDGQDDDDDEGDDGDESDEGDESMIDAKTPETPLPQSFDESTEPQSTSTPADQDKDIEMNDAVPEPQPAVSEPLSTEPLPPSPAVSQGEATGQETEVSLSATPALLAEQIEKSAAETEELHERISASPLTEPIAAATDSDSNMKEAEETVQKEEPLDTPSTSLAAVEDVKESPAEKQSPTAPDTPANEIQMDSQPVKPEENTPPLPPPTPEEKPPATASSEEFPGQTESETVAEDLPHPLLDNQTPEQAETRPNVQEEKEPVDTEISQDPLEERKDTDMTDAPNSAADNQEVAEEPAEPSEKPISPPVQLASTEPEPAEPTVEPTPTPTSVATEAPVPEAPVPEPSPPSIPTPAEPEAKDEVDPVPAPVEGEGQGGPVQEAEPEPEAREEEAEPEPETKKEESEVTPVPVSAADTDAA